MADLLNSTAGLLSQPKLSALASLDMSSMSGLQFEAVFDALTLAITGFGGVYNEPRCSIRGESNAAGSYIESLIGFLCWEKERLMNVCKAQTPKEPIDSYIRARLILRFEAECGDLSMHEMAALALSAVRQRAYIHVPEGKTSHYREASHAMSQKATREAILKQALSELQQWKRKYRDLQEFAALIDIIDRIDERSLQPVN